MPIIKLENHRASPLKPVSTRGAKKAFRGFSLVIFQPETDKTDKRFYRFSAVFIRCELTYRLAHHFNRNVLIEDGRHAVLMDVSSF